MNPALTWEAYSSKLKLQCDWARLLLHALMLHANGMPAAYVKDVVPGTIADINFYKDKAKDKCLNAKRQSPDCPVFAPPDNFRKLLHTLAASETKAPATLPDSRVELS